MAVTRQLIFAQPVCALSESKQQTFMVINSNKSGNSLSVHSRSTQTKTSIQALQIFQVRALELSFISVMFYACSYMRCHISQQSAQILVVKYLMGRA